jgi:hypothetical protein
LGTVGRSKGRGEKEKEMKKDTSTNTKKLKKPGRLKNLAVAPNDLIGKWCVSDYGNPPVSSIGLPGYVAGRPEANWYLVELGIGYKIWSIDQMQKLKFFDSEEEARSYLDSMKSSSSSSMSRSDSPQPTKVEVKSPTP